MSGGPCRLPVTIVYGKCTSGFVLAVRAELLSGSPTAKHLRRLIATRERHCCSIMRVRNAVCSEGRRRLGSDIHVDVQVRVVMERDGHHAIRI